MAVSSWLRWVFLYLVCLFFIFFFSFFKKKVCIKTMKTFEPKTKKKVRRKKVTDDVPSAKAAKKPAQKMSAPKEDSRFELDRFKGRSAKDSRGVAKKTKIKGRDLSSVAAPKTLKDYYSQLKVDKGEEAAPETEEADHYSSSSDSDSLTEESDIWEEGLKAGEQPDEEHLSEATPRLALRNCDWDHLKASHIFALLQSFAPMGGTLLSVKVFLSEYGKEHLELERTKGPDIWNKRGEADSVDEEEQEEEDGGLGSFERQPNSEDGSEEAADDEMSDEYCFERDDMAIKNDVTEEGERFSENKYRRYEMQRLRYYYAIATFDSSKTAAHVFSECDGTEIERSGTVFDLSFVPEEMEFTDEVDIASSVKTNFQANTTFVTNALQNSRFAISWDQTDPKRKRVMGSLFESDELNDDDVNQYLAPPDSSSDEDGPDREQKRKDIRSKYAALFESVGGLAEGLPQDEGLNSDSDMSEVEADDSGEEEEEDEEGEEFPEEESDIEVGMDESLSGDDADLVRQQLADLPDSDSDAPDNGISGNLESTMNIGAKEGSKNLKDVLKVKADREGETVWERKLRRKKESRKQAKKERAEDRKNITPEVFDKAEARKRLLKALDVEEKEKTGEGEGAPRRGKKDKRKAHKQAKVAAAAAERQAKRDKRLQAAGIGIHGKEEAPEAAQPAVAEIDPRYSFHCLFTSWL